MYRLRWFLCLIVVCNSSFAAQFEHVKVATSEYAPYTSEFAPQGGFINHIITAAFAEVGIEVEYEYMPWARALQKSIDGDYHGASYGYFSKLREKDFLHSDLLGVEYIFLFGLKGNVPEHWEELSELQEYRIGVTRGYGYNRQFWKFAESGRHKVSVVNTDMQNMRMLLIQRIDLFPMEELTAWHLLKKHFAREEVNSIQMLTPSLQTINTHFIIPRNLPDAETLMDKFNHGLGIIKNNGALAGFRDKLNEGYYVEGTDVAEQQNSLRH